MKNRIAFICLLLTVIVKAQDLSKIYEKVSPSVVVIFTTENDVIKKDGVNLKTSSQGLGSGFAISDTTVVTAAHVVNVPEIINVQFIDGEIIPANVISYNKTADVALLKLLWPKKNVKTVPFGDSNALKAGNRVFVVGAPFGLGQSLSAGYVSGFKKQSVGTNPFTQAEFIQTDAAINSGNSGGPLFNLQGEVVGVVSHITTKSGGFNGIGFASTSNLTVDLLMNHKSPWFGADLYHLTGEKAERFGVPQNSGLLVQRVVFSSLLGVMGIKGGDAETTINGEKVIIGGDIILAFDDIEFDTTDEALLKLAEFAESLEQGSHFEIKVLRRGEIITLGRKE